jgi:8-oxo-dGTP pyrophosphatase MutT (NUDIX family)
VAERLRQAGGIVVQRRGSRAARVLMVTSRRQPDVWIFPKGDIEPGESAARAARREVIEEAGVVGEVVRSLGTIRYPDVGFDVELELFLMDYVGESSLPHENRRERWVTSGLASRLHPRGELVAPLLKKAGQ